ALGEAAKAERANVDGLRLPVEDQLGQTGDDRRGDLEPRAAERSGEVETVQAVHAIQDGVAVGAVAVEGAVAPDERRALYAGHPVDEDARPLVGRAGRKAGASGERVGAHVPDSTGHADEGEGSALRPEVGLLDIVDDGQVGRPEIRGPADYDRGDG